MEKTVSARRSTNSMSLWATLLLAVAAPVNLLAEANYVYHERTTADPGCGGNYVTTLNPSSAQTYPLRFKVEYQFFTDTARVYYTTDGSTPGGTFGVGNVGTLVIPASFVCNFGGPLVDVWTATIPAQPAGTVVKYIVSAWHSGGGAEIFGNGPGAPCSCGTPTSSSTLATVHQYTVPSSPLDANALYWDSNGLTLGAGATPTGTWGTSTFWSGSFDGTSGTAGWTAGRNAVFSAGTDGSGTYTVTISGTQTAGGVTVEEGTVTFASGAASVGGGIVTVNSGATLSTDSSLRIAATAGSKLILRGGQKRSTNAGGAGSFVDADMVIELDGGGTVSHTVAGILNIINPTTPISGTGPLTKAGAGIIGVASACTYSGATIINDGILRVRATSNRLPIGTDVVINSPGVLDPGSTGEMLQQVNTVNGNGGITYSASSTLLIAGDADSTISGIISDGASFGRISKRGTGTLTLSAANTYDGRFTNDAGTTTITASGSWCGPACDIYMNGGIVNLNNAAQTVLSVAGAGGTINLGTGHTLTVNNGSTKVYTGTLAGPGALTKTGTAIFALGGNNTYDGNTFVSAGRIRVDSATALGSTSGYTEVASGGEILFDGATSIFTIDEPFRLAGPGGSENGAIAVQNGANVTISGPVTLTGTTTNTVSGTGTVLYNNANAITAVGDQNLVLQGGAPSTGNGGTISGVISLGAGSLTKQQGGRWTLSAANSYSGGTFLNAGTLVIANTTGSALGSGPVTTASGTTLSGPGSFTGTLTLGGTVSPGTSPGTMNTGSEIWNGGASYIWELNDAAGAAGTDPGWDLINITGTLTINATPASKFNLNVRTLTLANVSGSAANFNPAQDYSWTIATASGGISGFDPAAFNINTNGFTNPTDGGVFLVENVGNNINLRFVRPSLITCPGNITQDTDAGLCTAAVTWATPTSGTPPVDVLCKVTGGVLPVNLPVSSPYNFPKGTTTITCTATNLYGTNSCSFDVTVNDNEAPVIGACPATITVLSNVMGGAVATFSTPTATDNCTPAPTVDCVPASGSTFPVGANTVTCTATDAGGLTNACTFSVVVVAPVSITCPADFSLLTTGAAPRTVTFAPTVSGGGSPMSYCVPASGFSFPVGTSTVSCLVVDGSVSSCVVPDNGSGTANLPPAGCAYQNTNGVFNIVDGLPPGTAINIDGTLGSLACSGMGSVCSFPSGLCSQPGGGLGGEQECASGTLLFDMSGTGSLSGFTRSINIPFSIETHSAPRTNGQPIQTFATALFRAFGQITGDPDFDLLRVVGGTDFGLPSPGQTTLIQQPGNNWAVDSFFDITYRIDFVGRSGGALSGRSGSTTGTVRIRTGTPSTVEACSFAVVVADDVPTITCPPDVTVECTAVPLADFAGGSFVDHCDATPTITHVGDVTNGICPKIITRTYRLTDTCGYNITCAQTITMVDTTPPLVNCGQNETLSCGQGWGFTVPIVIDNCDGLISGSVVAIHTSTNFLCGNTFQATRIWQATDACGNITTCTQINTIVDFQAPALTACPMDLTVECLSAVPAPNPGDVSATDNCGGLVTVLHRSDVTNGVNPTIITRTYAVNDGCGNTNTTCVQTITVQDTIPPVAACQNISVTLTGPNVVITPAQVNNGSSDNCGTVNLVSVSPNTFTSANEGANNVTLTVSDNAGLLHTCMAVVTVVVPPPSVTNYYTVKPADLAPGKPQFSLPHGTGTNPFGYDWDSAAPLATFGAPASFEEASFYASVTNAGATPPDRYRTFRIGLRSLFGQNVTISEVASLSYQTRKPAAQTEVDWRLTIYTTREDLNPGNNGSFYRSRLQATPNLALSLNAPSNQWNGWSTAVGDNQFQFKDNRAGFGTENVLWSELNSGPVTRGANTWDWTAEEVMMIDITLGANSGGGTARSQLDAVQIVLTSGDTAIINLDQSSTTNRYEVYPTDLASGKPEFSPPHGTGANPFGYDWDSAAPLGMVGSPVGYECSSFFASVDDTGATQPDRYRTFRIGLRTLFGRNVTIGEVGSVSYQTRKNAPQTDWDWRLTFYTTHEPLNPGNSASWHRSRIQSLPFNALGLDAPANQWNLWSTSEGTNQLRFYQSNRTGFGVEDMLWSEITGGPVTRGPNTWNYSTEEVMMIDITLGANSGGGDAMSQLDAVRIRLTDGSIADISLEAVPASGFHVDDDYTGLPDGTVVTFPNGAGGPTYTIGCDAFATLASAVSNVNVGGTIVVAPGTYPGVVIAKSLSLDLSGGGVIIQGASPALTVSAGIVGVNGGTFTTATDDPTILVNGGALTMRNALVEESSGFNQVAISVTSGTIDLGTTGDLGGNTVKITMAGSLISNGTATAIPALGNTYKQDGADITSNFDIEDEILHRLDDAARGLVTYVANNVYVTTGSGSIQRGIDAVVSGDTVNVGTGIYDELVTINKNLSLLSGSGKALTTIQNTAGTGVGTVVVTTGSTGVQIGDVNQGFTIIGTDGPPGIEEAAIYFQGNHSNAKVIGNNVVAAGDSGLLTEFGLAINNITVTDNEFSGQTFIGPNPADVGFANQFTTPNVPRQLVVLANSTGSGALFSCNVVSGTAGGLNPMSQPQGNQLVTIDINNATIQYNTFSGISDRFGDGLRARGTGAIITGNTFTGGTPVGLEIGSAAAATAHVVNNSFAATYPLAALGNGGAAQLDAQSNWWGHVSGPTIASNPGGTGGIVAGNVDFSPWLGEATDTSGACGFQPNDANIVYAPATLSFSTQPGGANTCSPLAPQPVVQVLDENNNVAAQFQGAVTLAIGSNPGGGVLGGMVSVNAVNGVATFAGLSINQPGVGYTLVASVPGLPNATSSAFDILNAAPVITVLGSNPLTNECHVAFVDPGFTALDDCTATPTLTTNSPVNANVPGTYTVTYVATDGNGASATNTRTVVVVDTTAPVITVLGANPLTNECHVAFVDPGATALDSCAGTAESPDGIQLYFNSFDTTIADWDAFGGSFNATRVASGNNGITSATGAFHAESSASGSASRWGGYNYGAGNAVPTVFQEYTTSVDVYLNVGGGWTNNTRFDFSSAINNNLGVHRRDFIFNAGFYNDTDGSPGSGTSRFVISASNGSQPGSAFAKNPARSPIAISATGWYTFKHRFYDNAGVLAVEMSIYDSSSVLVSSWVLSDPSDVIGVIGGNRYGWFAFNHFSTLAFDNAELRLAPGPFVLTTSGMVDVNTPGTYTITYVATDPSGNSATNTRTVVVVDTTPPTIACVADKTNECTDVWTFDAPSASDTCGSATIAIVSTLTNATCGNTYIATRTWSASDPSGNSNVCAQTVTVVDTTAPTITCVLDKTIECGTAWTFDAPSATDTCGPSPTIAMLGTVTNLMCGNTLTATRTWSASDGCGNSNVCSQTVTVVDTTAPTITCAPDKSVECGTAWTFDAPSATDVCGPAPTIANLGTVTNAGLGNTYVATRTWSATDACGNSNTCSQTVTVVDTMAPVITMLGANPLTNECSVPFMDPGFTALDGCPPAAAPVLTTFDTFTIGNSVNYQGTGGTRTYASVPPGAGIYTVPDPYGNLWTVSDEWGLGRIATPSATDDFDERVVDDGTGNKVWRLSNARTGSFSDQPNSPNSPAAAGESTALLWNDRGPNHTTPVISARAGATSRDFHGGFRFKSATGAAQAGLTINVSPTARQSDRRNSFVSLVDSGSGLDVNFVDVAADGATFPTTTIATGLSYSGWHKIDIYIQFVDGLNLDGSGNDIVTVKVNDVTVHVGTTWETFYRIATPTRPVGAVDALMFRSSTAAPANLGNGFFFDDVVVDNNRDSSLTLTTTSTVNSGTPGTYTVTYTATDPSGNSATNTRTVVVVDTTPPVVACADVTVSLTGLSVSITPAQVYASGSDTCGTPILVAVTPDTFTCPGVYPATLQVSDGNGNTNTCIAMVTVLDGRPTPTVVYVDDSYVGLTNCASVDFPYTGAGPYIIGYNAFATIQGGITAVASGGTVNVAAGTYLEDVLVNKTVSLLGAGAGLAVVEGPIGGTGSSTFQFAANGIVLDGFTITRAGNNPVDWNNPALNSAGVAIQGLAQTGSIIRNCLITGMRSAIDINNSGGHAVRNNIITNNHTGVILRNQTDSLAFTENFIADNRTVGVLFLDASGGSNVPVQQAANCQFSSNSISGNWYGQIVDRQAGGSIPAPGTSNLKNFSGNWLGTITPVVTTANSAEPGYAVHIPVIFGGAATPPGGQPDLAGGASANIDYTPYLHVGTDTSPAIGFQGDYETVQVVSTGAQTGSTGRIQEGVNLVSGSTVLVGPGNYSDNVVITSHVNVIGSGSGNNPAADSIVTATSSALPVFSIIDAGGASAGDRLRIEALRLLGGSSGLTVRATGGTHEFYQFSNLAAVNNSLSGIDLGGTATLGQVVITGSTLTNNGVFGVQVTNSLTLFSGLELSGSTVSDNGSLGLGVFGSDTNPASPTDVRVSNSTFARNGSPASGGDGDVTFFKFNGNASLENVTISGDSQFPLQFRGKGALPSSWLPAGNVGLTNVVINGTTARPGLYIVLYSDVTGFTFSNVDLIGHVAPLLPSGFASAMQVIHSGAAPLQLGSLKLPSLLTFAGTNITGGSGALAMLGTGGAVASCDTVISNAWTPMLKELAVYDFNDTNVVGDVVFPAFTITATSGNITNECAGPAGAVVSFTVNATSDCTVNSIVCDPASGSLFAQGVTTVNCVAYDNAGNSNATSFVVAIIDTTAPVITCPADVIASANVGQCFATGVALGTATAVDLCDGASVSNNAPVSFPVGNTPVIWTAYDVHGNSSTCTQLVTVLEHVAPIITCPVDLTVQCDVPLIPANTGSASATDNCDPNPALTYLDTLTLNISSNNLDGWAVFITGVPLTATGELVNGPATPPVGTGSFRASVGANGENNVEVRSGGYSGVLLSNLTELNYRTYRTVDGGGLNKAAYLVLNIDSDGNGFGDDVISFEPQYQSGGNPLLPNQGPTQTGVWQSWNALIGGWSSQNNPNLMSPGTNVQTLATYIAAFPNARILNSPSGGGVRLGAGGGSGLWDNFDGNVDRVVIGTNGVSTAYNFDRSAPPGCNYIVARTWTATDGSGNTSFCTQLISVEDTFAPVLTCPADITVANAPGVCGATVSFTTTATDNCSTNITLVCTPASGSLFAVGTNSVTCRADDGCGNTNLCSFNIIVNDTELPSLVSCAPAQLLIVDSSCLAALPDFTGLVSATDNCAVASVTQSPLVGTLLPIGIHPVTFTVTDPSGNTTNCTTLVTVREADAPVILACAPPQVILLTNVCTMLLPDYTGLVSATNICGGVTITQNPPPGTLLGIGVTNVVFTVINSSSNSTTCGTTVTVRDTIAPVITCPASFVLKVGDSTTGGVVNFTVTATDECDMTPALVCTPASGSLFPMGSTTVLCSAVDDSDNTNTCSFTVTVFMATNTCVADGRTIPDNNINGLASTKLVSTPMGIITDLNVTLSIFNGWNGDLYAYLVHDSGFTVLLNRVGRTGLAPIGYGDPGFDVTIDDQAVNGDIHLYRPNPLVPLGGPLTGSWAPDARSADPALVTDLSPRTDFLSSFNGLNPNGEWTLFIADVEGGDVSTLVGWCLEICGLPPVAPSINTQPLSQTVECSSNAVFTVTTAGTAPLTNQWYFNGTPIIDATNVTLTLPGASLAQSGTYTFVLCNMAGCVTSTPAALVVQDTRPPTVTCPTNMIVECASPSGTIVNFAASAVDDCDAILTVVCTPPSGSVFLDGATTVNCLVVDVSGNSNACSFTISVVDRTAPVLCVAPPVSSTYGTLDNFNGPEASTPSANLLLRVIGVDLRGFDTNLVDAWFAHTITNIPQFAAEATLRIKMRAVGGETTNDTITIGFAGPGGVLQPPQWSRRLGQVGTDPGLLGTPWTPGLTNEFVLNLGALPNFGGPPSDFMAALRSYGHLDLLIQDDTDIDSIVLEVSVCQCEANIVVNAPSGLCATNVTYAAPAFTDVCDTNLTIICLPPSGSVFAVGVTEVACAAIDDSGNSNRCSFTITVLDTVPPSITCPANLTVNASGPGCAASVNYSATVSDNCGSVSVACVPPSGSTFLPGTNTVVCTATDAGGNTNSCSFTITVQPSADLSVAVVTSPNPIIVGNELLYTVTVSNQGPCLATGITLSNLLSPGQTLVRVTNGIGSPGMACPALGPVAWWRAENDATDSAGVNHGALNGGVTFVAGEVGQAFQFDGVNDYVSVPDAPALRPASFTLEGWVRIQDPNGVHVVVSKPKGSGSADSYAIWVASGVLYAAVSDNSGSGQFLTYPELPTSSLFKFNDVVDLQSLANKLKNPAPADAVSQFLSNNLTAATLTLLAAYVAGPDDALQHRLVGDFNSIIQSGAIYTPARFAGVTLSAESQYVLGRNPTGVDLVRLNRLLIRDAYPAEIAMNLFPQLNQRYHVAYSFDDVTKVQALYINGVLVDMSVVNKTITYDAQSLLIGADDNSGTPASFFQGDIDELTLYARALTGTEIESIHRVDGGGKCATPGAYPVGSLAPGASHTVFLVSVPTNCVTVSATANVVATSVDPFLANNSATGSSVVQDISNSQLVLTIKQVSQNSSLLEICWPTICGPYELQGTGDLTPPITWTTVATPVQTIGDKTCTIVQPSDSMKYFRLRRP